jgi:hypothetical protein
MAIIVGNKILVNGMIVGSVKEYRDNVRVLIIKSNKEVA